MQRLLDRQDSPLGKILLVFDENGALHALDFADHVPRMHRLLRLHRGPADLVDARAPDCITRPLERYFAGDHGALSSIAVQTAGTPFQRDVWAALRRIPSGATSTYGAIARDIGRPSACRAVGLANGANPVAIVVPCHRVVGAGGALTGFGGGLHRKAWLLAHEAPGPRLAVQHRPAALV